MFYNRLKNVCEGHGDAVAFSDIYGKDKTYKEFIRDVEKYMVFFSQIPEKRIGIMGAGSYLWVCQVYGAISVGKTIIDLDPFQSDTNLISMLHYSKAEIVIHDEPDEELKGTLTESLDIIYRGYYELSGNDDGSDSVSNVEVNDGEIIIFTSGTSRQARGAVILPLRSWDNLEPGIPIWTENQPFSKESEGRSLKIYMPIPMNHIYSVCMTLLHIIQGYTIYYGDVRRFIPEVKLINPDVMTGVSTMIEALIAYGKPDNLKLVMSSGGPCSSDLQKRARECNLEIRNIYGASEIGGIAFNKYGDDVTHLTPLAGNTIRIDESGVIWLSSPNIMKEYFDRELENSEFFCGEWVTFGDMGAYNSDGTFHIDGRRINLIAMDNGDKLFTNEIEEQLCSYEGIKEAAILYIDGQIIAALVADEGIDSSVLSDAVKDYNRSQQYQFKIGKTWVRDSVIPRLGMRKVDRLTLEKEYRSSMEDV